MKFSSRAVFGFLVVAFLIGLLSLGFVLLFSSNRSVLTPAVFPARSPEITRVLLPGGQGVKVELYATLELVFTASVDPANPFDTYLLKLEVTDPKGRKLAFDGFYDGDGNGGQQGRVWKARISPYLEGIWTWRTLPGDAGDPALANLSGSFEVVPGHLTGGLVAKGRYFTLQSGEAFFPAGNFLDFSHNLTTTHTFMSEVLSDGQRDALIARQRDFHGSNKANLYLANRGDYKGQSVTPWVGTAAKNDKTRMDLARWHAYDGYIQRFSANSMLAELWFFADDSNFGRLPEADAERLIRYAMARTSAFSGALYVLALEWQEGFSAQAIDRLGEYTQAHNPWGRLLSVHGKSLARWPFGSRGWAGFIDSQAYDVPARVVNEYAIGFHQGESIPHLAEEFGRLNRDSDPDKRAAVWASFCGGAAGVGTGSDLKAFLGFLSQSGVPFQRMRPANDLVSGGGSTRFVLAEVGHHYVVYSTGGGFILDLAGDGWQGYWYNPRDPESSLGVAFSVLPGTQNFTPPVDQDLDWVLWITDGRGLTAGRTHPSPGPDLLSIQVFSGGKPSRYLYFWVSRPSTDVN